MTRRPRHNERGERMVDLFAEAISQTGEITSAAQLLGITRDYGKTLFRRIRIELGEQAR